jgi:hypothetical protein
LENLVLAFPSAFSPREALAQAISKAANAKLEFEGDCVVCKTGNPAELAAKLSVMFGVDKVAVARKVENQFSSLSKAIVDIAKKTILPNEKFFVKVQALGEPSQNYAERDVEFAASGTLTAELVATGARPAKSESDADRVALAFTGSKSAYVCIFVHKGPGGLPSGYLGSASCAIYDNPLSFWSCLLAARSGFHLQITLLYEDDVLENAKAMQALANAIGVKEHVLKIARTSIPASVGGATKTLIRDKVAMRVLAAQGGNVVMPLMPAVHPQWFIDSAIRELSVASKTPYTPLMFLLGEPSFYGTSRKSRAAVPDATNVKKSGFKKYDRVIDSAAKSAIKNMKEIKLKVGPDYLHDVLDSV